MSGYYDGRPAPPMHVTDPRRRWVLETAVNLMGNTAWKNEMGAPEHDHRLAEERNTTGRLANCPRCGDAATKDLWPIAIAEAEQRLAALDQRQREAELERQRQQIEAA